MANTPRSGGPPQLAAPPAEQLPFYQRNFILGLVNGVFFNASASLISLSLVLPGLIRDLGGAHVLVGTLAAFDQAGWLMPQLLVGAGVQHRQRKLPVYQLSGILRAVFFVAMVVVVALAGLIPTPITLASLVVLYALYSLGAGWAAVPYQEVVAKTIPPDRRGRYFGLRQLGGGVATLLVVSPIVGAVLSEGSPLEMPQNYALLFGLACACAIAGLVAFSLVREPPSQETRPAGTLRSQLRLLPGLWREHPNLRRFLVYRVLSRLAAIAQPFYIVYAQEVMGIPKSMIGEYMAIITVVLLLSNLPWSRFSDRQGNRILLRLGSGLFAAASPLALLLPFVGDLLGLSLRANAYLFAGVFVLSGLGDTCLGIGVTSYVLEMLPERDRPAGLGLVNTAAGVASLLTILGGSMIDLLGYQPLFFLATGLALGGFLLSWPLAEPRQAAAG